jgi:hypothetical protein
MLPRMSDASSRVILAGVFLCETVAAFLVGAGGRPLAGAGCGALALSLAFGWLHRQRRHVRAARQERLAVARAQALAEDAAGRDQHAIEILEETGTDTPLDGPAARLLIELYARRDELTPAVEVALQHLGVLDPGDVRNMIASLEAWDERQHASALAFAVAIRARASKSLRLRPR